MKRSVLILALSLLLIAPMIGILPATSQSNSQSTNVYVTSVGNNFPNATAIAHQLKDLQGFGLKHSRTWNMNTNRISALINKVMQPLEHSYAVNEALGNHSNTTTSIGINHNFTSNTTEAILTVNWQNATDIFSLQIGYYPNNGTVTAPSIISYPIAVASTNGGSSNWGGYVYDYVTGWWILSSNQQMTAMASNINVAAITMPPYYTDSSLKQYSQADPGVQQNAAMWIGISNGEQGTGGLAQVGYTRDASYYPSNDFSSANSNAPYYLWYEYYPNTPMIHFAGNPTVSPGQVVDFTVQQSSTLFTFEFYNYNTGSSGTVSYTVSSAPTMYFGDTVVEATTIGSTVQQIARFSNVNFEGTTIYSDGSNMQVTQLHNSSTYYDITMEQSGTTANTQSNYIMQTGTYDTSLFGYPQITWLTSDYGGYSATVYS